MTTRFAALSGLLVWGALHSPASALADTYHVAPDGSDSAAGSTAAPFATLQRAADAAQPGDTVEVEDGSYVGFAARRGGSEGNPITFRANGDAVVLDRPCDDCSGSGIHLRNPESPRSHIVIDGFTVRDMPAYGVLMSWTTNVVVRNCTVRDNTNPGIYGGHVTDPLIEDNAVFGNDNHGIHFANSSTGPRIRRNRVCENANAGMHFNGDVRFPPGDGVIRDVRIEENWIYDNGQNGLNWDGVQDSVVANNVIFGNASNGIRAFGGPGNDFADSAEGPQNNLFVNNTIVTFAAGRWCIRITDDLGGNVVFNNILLSGNPTAGSISLDATMGFREPLQPCRGPLFARPRRYDSLPERVAGGGLRRGQLRLGHRHAVRERGRSSPPRRIARDRQRRRLVRGT